MTTVTGVPSQPRTFYMGVASGGLFRTTDGGATWTPITDGKIPRRVDGLDRRGGVRSEHHLPRHRLRRRPQQRVDRPRRLQVDRRRRDLAVRSACTTPGRSARCASIRRIRTSRGSRRYGDAFKRNAERGVFKTTTAARRGGRCCSSTTASARWTSSCSPANPNIVYAVDVAAERKPWTIISGARDGGFYKSTDGGEHFTQDHDRSCRPELIGKANLAVTAAKPESRLRARRGEARRRALSIGRCGPDVDAGELAAGPDQRPFYYTTLGADPTNADVVYAGAESFFKSTDGGKTFTPLRTPHGDNHDIWINPKDGNIMIQSNDGGANVSFDGGRTWSSQMNQPTAEIYGVWLDNQFPYKLYGAQQDDTTVIITSQADPVSRATTGGAGPAARPVRSCRTRRIPTSSTAPARDSTACMNLNTGQEKNYWVGAQSLYGNPAQRSDLPLPARVADGGVAARSRRAVLRVAVPAPHARRGRHVGKDLAGPDGASRIAARASAASRSRAT